MDALLKRVTFKELKKIVPGYFSDYDESWFGYLDMNDFSWLKQHKTQFSRLLELASEDLTKELETQLTILADRILPTCRRLYERAINIQKRKLQREDELRKRQRLEREQSVNVFVDLEEEEMAPDDYLPSMYEPEQPTDVKPNIADIKPSTSASRQRDINALRPPLRRAGAPSPEEPQHQEEEEEEEDNESRNQPSHASKLDSDGEVSDLETNDVITEEPQPAEGGEAPSWTPSMWGAPVAPTPPPTARTTSPNLNYIPQPSPVIQSKNEKIIKVDMKDIIRRYNNRQDMLNALRELDNHKVFKDRLSHFDGLLEKYSKK